MTTPTPEELRRYGLALAAMGTEIRTERLVNGSWVVVGGSLHRYCVTHDIDGVAAITDAVNHLYPTQVEALAAAAEALGLTPVSLGGVPAGMVSIPGLAVAIERLQTNIAECRAHPYAGFLITLADAEAIVAALSGSHPTDAKVADFLRRVSEAVTVAGYGTLQVVRLAAEDRDHNADDPCAVEYWGIVEKWYALQREADAILRGSSTPETAEDPEVVSLKDVEAAVKSAIGLVLVRREQESVRGPIIRYHDVPDEKAAESFWEAVQARLHPQEEAKTPPSTPKEGVNT